MADRPILFSAPMVRALLDGTKTQTRRLIPPATQDAYAEYDDWCRNVSAGVPTSRQWEPEYFLERTCIQPGDRLWVREAWKSSSSYDETPPRTLPQSAPIHFTADDRLWPVARYRPGIHMPRWASRLTLTVTDVRVQRLQEISEGDATAEGAELDAALLAGGLKATYRGGFARIWAGIHEPHPNNPTSWGNNPWVAAYTFTVERRNIDMEVPHV